MSLVRRDTDSLRDVRDNLRLSEGSNQSPSLVQYHIEGHFYHNPVNLISGGSTLNLGNLGRMCMFPEMIPHGDQSDEGYAIAQLVVRLMTSSMLAHNRSTRSSQLHENTQVVMSLADHDASDTDHQSRPSISEAPSDYKTREADWFKPGRYFRIWAREGDNVDSQIHDKEFILLDTKNIAGPGLLVRQHTTEQCEGHRGSFNRTHVLLKNYHNLVPHAMPGSQPNRKIVYMDEEEEDVAENTFIELEHAYNIPFVKYKCIDYGVLTVKSLKDLRRYYVGWLKYQWDLE